MQPRRILWFGAVLAGLGAFWAWFFSLNAAQFLPLCRDAAGGASTWPECRWLQGRIVAMWCVAGLGGVLLGWGFLRWWRGRRGSSTD